MATSRSKAGSKPKTSRAKARSRPKWTKAPAALVEVFAQSLRGIPNVEQRQMFGYPAAFTNTQMFAGLFQDKIIVRLSEADRDALLSVGGKPFEPMRGRPMREYVLVPPALMIAPPALRAWLDKAHAYAASLQPKAKKRR